MSDLFDSPAPVVEFDHLGRYLLPDPKTGEKKAWTRVTTFAKTLSDTYHLDRWKQRKVAEGLVARPDLLDLVVKADDNRTLNSICDRAMETAGASIGRDHGTAMHGVIERINRGENVEVPPHMAADVAAYRQAIANAGIEMQPEYVERRVINTTYNLAGTFDGIAKLPNWMLCIADLKTAHSMDYSWLETSIQLAAYAYAPWLLTDDLTAFEPMPDVDREIALVIHLPAGQGTCRIYEVDIATGWFFASMADDVRKARKTRDLATEHRPTP